MRTWIGLVLFSLAATFAHAGQLPPTAKTEIAALLDGLASSGCQFYRNGTWHTGAEAKAHLQMKLDYLVKKDGIASSEGFIEKVGTKSSTSGQAYRVRCADDKEEPSAAWLNNELRRIRKTGANGKPAAGGS